jgi:hypothetical protein
MCLGQIRCRNGHFAATQQAADLGGRPFPGEEGHQSVRIKQNHPRFCS